MSTQQRALGSVADLMAGLMMVFLFIAIAYMIQVKSSQIALEEEAKNAKIAKEEAEHAREQAEASAQLASEKEQRALQSQEEAEASRQDAAEGKRRSDEIRSTMQEIAAEYTASVAALDAALQKEFDKDLKRWHAEIENGAIRFLEPDILFDTNSDVIKPPFRLILDDFFPRYLAILASPAFHEEIEEVRIEGHTSTEWRDAANDEDRYLNNAALSQRRALSVLQYCFAMRSSRPRQEWLIKTLRANGLSFANPILNADGSINPERSRRVEFRAITRTTEKIRRILEAGNHVNQQNDRDN